MASRKEKIDVFTSSLLEQIEEEIVQDEQCLDFFKRENNYDKQNKFETRLNILYNVRSSLMDLQYEQSKTQNISS